MPSRAQRIISEIVTRLRTISTGNGYETDIGTNVEDSRPNWDQEADLPAISVFEFRTSSVEAPDGRRKTIHVMPVLIKVFLKRGTDAANARTAISDIKKAILGTGTQANNYLDERWPITIDGKTGGLAMVTKESGHLIEYAENTYEIVGAQVEIEISYITDKFVAES